MEEERITREQAIEMCKKILETAEQERIFPKGTEKEYEMNTEELNRCFTYHLPKGDQPYRYKQIRLEGKNLAETINSFCPESREKSIAFNKLEEAVMWANAAIARNE